MASVLTYLMFSLSPSLHTHTHTHTSHTHTPHRPLQLPWMTSKLSDRNWQLKREMLAKDSQSYWQRQDPPVPFLGKLIRTKLSLVSSVRERMFHIQYARQTSCLLRVARPAMSCLVPELSTFLMIWYTCIRIPVCFISVHTHEHTHTYTHTQLSSHLVHLPPSTYKHWCQPQRTKWIP